MHFTTRRLRARPRLLLALLVLLASFGISHSSVTVAGAVVIDVTTNADTLNPNDGECSLREAIIAVNTGAPSGPAAGECPGGDGDDDIIELQPVLYTLDRTSGSEDEQGDLDIRASVTIRNAVGKAAITQDDLEFRLVEIHSTAAIVEFENVNFLGGEVNGTPDPAEGGAMFIHDGTSVTLLDPFFSSNDGVLGGAIFNRGSLTIEEGLFSGNDVDHDADGAPGHGGAIYNDGGAVTVRDSVFEDNTAADASEDTDEIGGHGGAIYSDGGSIVLERVLLRINGAGDGAEADFEDIDGQAGGNGGAIYIVDGTLQGRDIYFWNNSAGQGGSPGQSPFGLAEHGTGGHGGAIYAETSTVTLSHTGALPPDTGDVEAGDPHFAENFAGGGGHFGEERAGRGGSGGAIFALDSTVQLTDIDFEVNGAGPGGDADGTDFGGPGGHGGAIAVFGSSSTLTADGGSFFQNAAGRGGANFSDDIISGLGGNGGAIYLEEGSATLTGVAVEDNDAGDSPFPTDDLNDGHGGGIAVFGTGSVTVVDSLVARNFGRTGGGIYVHGETDPDEFGELTLSQDSVVEENEALSGAGIWSAGVVTVNDSIIQRNSARRVGGGIYTDHELTLNGALIGGPDPADGNTATEGGGIFVDDGIATLNGTTVENNEADELGGGIAVNDPTLVLDQGSIVRTNRAGESGGGISGERAEITVMDSTVEGNEAGGSGGGIYNEGNQFAGASITVGDGSIINGNRAAVDGGGIYANTLEMLTVGGGTEISDNVALGGGVILGAGVNGFGSSAGGGIFILDTTTEVSLSSVVDNAAGQGGGIAVFFSEPFIQGIEPAGGFLSAFAIFEETTIDGNTALRGGGLLNAGLVLLDSSTVSNNRAVLPVQGLGLDASSVGALGLAPLGIPSFDPGHGGGFFNSGLLLAVNSTISGNTAEGLGGGIFDSPELGGDAPHYLGLVYVTIAFNAADGDVFIPVGLGPAGPPSLTGGGIYQANGEGQALGQIVNTLLAQNTGGNCAPEEDPGYESFGDNLSTDDTCGEWLDQPDDIHNGNANLDELGDYGGPTFTHALLAGSEAIDMAACVEELILIEQALAPLGLTALGENVVSLVLDEDQRSVFRPQGLGCDIGAFELEYEFDIEKVALVDEPVVRPGESFEYELRVSTTGPDLPIVEISDELPAELVSPVSFTFDGWDTEPVCNVAGQAVTCTGGVVAAGTTATIRFTVGVRDDAEEGAVLENVAVMRLEGSEGQIVVESETATLTVALPRVEKVALVEGNVVKPGDTFEYEISIINPSSALPLTEISDELPAELIPPSSFSFSGWDIEPVCNVAGQTVSCTGGTVPANSTATVRFEVTVRDDAADGAILLNLAVMRFQGLEEEIVVESEPAVLVVSIVHRLAFAKYAAPSVVAPGEPFAWVFVVTNIGEDTLTNVTVGDPQLSLAQVYGLNPASQADIGGFAGCDAAGAGFVGGACVVPTLEPGETAIISVGMRAFPAAPEGTYPNTASAFSDQTDPVAGISNVVVVTDPEMRVDKVALVPEVSQETPTRFRVTISNPSATETLTGVELEDPVPLGLVASNAGGSMGCTIGGHVPAQVVEASGLTIPPDQSLVCEFDVRLADGASPVSGQQFVNVARARADGVPEVQDLAWVTARAPELSIEKTSGGTVSGMQGSYRLLVINTGDAPAAGIVIEDVIPLGLAFEGEPVVSQSAGAPPNCAIAGNPATLTCSGGDPLPAGGLIEVRFEVRLAGAFSGSQVSNQACVSAPGLLACDSVISPVASPQLSVSKVNDVQAAGPGTTVTSTIVVRNIGSASLSGVGIADTLPAGTAFVAAGSHASCAAVALEVTCGGGVTLGPNQTVTFTVRFTVLAGEPGTLCNAVTTTNTSGAVNGSAEACLAVGGGGDGYLVHVDVDAAMEDAVEGVGEAGAGGTLGGGVDPDDATGSLHTVCLVSPLFGAADDQDIVWSIEATSGAPTVSPEPDGDSVVLALPEDAEANCVQWRSGGAGTQRVEAEHVLSGQVFEQGPDGAPVVKGWSGLDRTHLAGTTGTVGDTLVENTGGLGDWAGSGGGHCDRVHPADPDGCLQAPNLDGASISADGTVIPAGANAGKLLAEGRAFVDYVLGSGPFTGPLDGARQTFTLNPPGSGGTCGSLRVEDPLSAAAQTVTADGGSVSVLSSDKGVGFQVVPNSDGAAQTTFGNADCRPGDRTVVRIATREDSQLNSLLDTAPDETVTVRWQAPLPEEKVPLLPWAGTRQPVQHNWTVGGLCILELGTEAVDASGSGQSVLGVRYVKTGGPGGFTGNELLPGDLFYGLPQTATQAIVAIDPETCNSTAVFEAEGQGEADVEMELIVVDLSGPVPVVAGASGSKVAQPLFFLEFEDVTVGAVAGTRSGHNAGPWTPANPYLGAPQDAGVSADRASLEANVSRDVLVRARVRGWFLNANPSGRAAATKTDYAGGEYSLPANRWVLPDDWERLAGGVSAEVLRPNWDLGVEPLGRVLCATVLGECYDSVTGVTVAGYPVAGPYTPLDPGTHAGPSHAPYVGGGVYRSVVPDGDVDWWDAPMQPAQLTWLLVDEGSAPGGFRAVDKAEVYYLVGPVFTNPYYATHVPATAEVSALADGGGFLWDTWADDGLYVFWDSLLVNEYPASGAGVAHGTDRERPGSVVARTHTVYTDNHGEAMTYINGDEVQSLLSYEGCAENPFTGTPHCAEGDAVGLSRVAAVADYPDFRPRPQVSSLSTADVTWTWGGFAVLEVSRDGPDGERLPSSQRALVLHVLDRDGFCDEGLSLHPVLDGLVTWTVESADGIFVDGEVAFEAADAAKSATTRTFDHSTRAAEEPDRVYPPLDERECQTWVIVQNSLETETDVFVESANPEGPLGFDAVLFTDQADLLVTKTADTDETGVGETLTYTVTIRNNGDLSVENIAIADSLVPFEAMTCAAGLDDGRLEPLEQASCSYQHTVTEADPDPLVNEVTVTGTAQPEAGPEVTLERSASAAVDVLFPALAVQKLAPEQALAASSVQYTFVVTNSGDTTLYNLTAADDVLGEIGDCSVTELAPGAQVVCAVTEGLPADGAGTELMNTVTVAASDSLGRQVEAFASHTLAIVSLEVQLFEGWNEVAPWVGAPFLGLQAVLDGLTAAVSGDWFAVAGYDNGAGLWSQSFKDAPLPAFNTLDAIERGRIYWIFGPADTLLTFPLQ